MKEPILKSDNPYKFKSFVKKSLATIAMASCLLGSSLGFVGCNVTPDDPGTTIPVPENPPVENPPATEKPPVENPPIDTPPVETPPVDTPPVEDKITFEEFLSEYNEEANDFALDLIQELSYYNNALSTSYSFVCEEDKITQILVANVVQTGETERELKIATINIVGGMEIEDILDGEETQTITIESETALTFDAKEEYNNSTDIHSQIENIIQENLGENATQVDEYEVEEFEPESPLPQTVAEMVAEYPEKVNEVLNEYFLSAVLKTGRFSSLDSNLVHDAKWYLNGKAEVESLDFMFHYGDSNGKNLYVINLDLKESVTINDVLNNNSNLTNISTTRTPIYMFGYNPTIQGTRDELMNAIFEVYGMGSTCPEGAVRLFKDNGYVLSDTYGETHNFQVVQILDNEIKQH